MAGCQLLIVQKLLARSFLTSIELLTLWITLFCLRSCHSMSKTLHRSLFVFMLTNRTRYVFLNNESSSKGLVRNGVFNIVCSGHSYSAYSLMTYHYKHQMIKTVTIYLQMTHPSIPGGRTCN